MSNLYRISEIPGRCPTNKGRIFYYPEVNVRGEWKSIHAMARGIYIDTVSIAEGLEGWGEKYMAERVIRFHKYQSEINETK